MRIKWFAHAAFLLEGSGLRIITDPYTPHKAGFAPITDEADLVLRSSDDDSAHANVGMIAGNPRVVTATKIPRDGLTVRGLHVKPIPTKESMIHKLEPRDNAMYCFTLDGVRMAHFGDVGNPLEDWQLEQLAGVEVVFAPTGGPPTIELADLYAALEVLKPRLTIPMHYQLPGCKFPRMLAVTDFTGHFSDDRVIWAGGPMVELTRADLPAQPHIMVLQATAAGE